MPNLVQKKLHWKDAYGKTSAFCKHECSSLHKQAVEVIYTFPRTTPVVSDIGKLLSTAHASKKEYNRKYLLEVTQTVQYLTRQELSLKGNGNENDSNFVQVLILQANDDPKILRRQTSTTVLRYKMNYCK